MDTEEELYERIDRYLAGELEGEMLRDFEEWMEKEPGLAEQVKLHKEVGETLRNSAVFEFIQSWEGVREEFESRDLEEGKAKDFRQDEAKNRGDAPLAAKASGKRKWNLWIGIAASIALLAALGIWLLQPGNLQNPEIHWATADKAETRRLADGSQVELYPNSVLTYPEKFSDGERKVNLNGAGRFEVARNPERPFRVLAGGTQTEVLGTIFTVRAYQEEDTTWVAVEEGRVSFGPTKTDDGPGLILEAGQAGFWESEGEKALMAPSGIPGMPEASRQKLIFDNTALSEVIEALETHYAVKIDWEGRGTSGCPFSGPLAGKNIEEDLEVIKIVTGLEVKKSGDALYTLKGECQ